MENTSLSHQRSKCNAILSERGRRMLLKQTAGLGNNAACGLNVLLQAHFWVCHLLVNLTFEPWQEKVLPPLTEIWDSSICWFVIRTFFSVIWFARCLSFQRFTYWNNQYESTMKTVLLMLFTCPTFTIRLLLKKVSFVFFKCIVNQGLDQILLISRIFNLVVLICMLKINHQHTSARFSQCFFSPPMIFTLLSGQNPVFTAHIR